MTPPVFRILKIYFSVDSKLYRSLKNILGFYPGNISVYKQAFRHSSAAGELRKGFKDSNERLEYLGDAVLGTVISDFLFRTFPYKDEGFLTKMRSKIVSRYSLNRLGMKFGINTFIQKSGDSSLKGTSIIGDAFEALIGAIYVDQGYGRTRDFILERVVKNYIDLEQLENTEFDFKSKLIEWVQKEKKKLSFNLVKELGSGSEKQFVIEVIIDTISYAEGIHYSKKRAEQIAAEQTCIKLQL